MQVKPPHQQASMSATDAVSAEMSAEEWRLIHGRASDMTRMNRATGIDEREEPNQARGTPNPLAIDQMGADRNN
jgi:hypothetical protein